MTQEERLEWLEKRRTGLGGTDIAKIIVDAAPHAKRVGCYRGSIFQMWAEKVGLHQPSEYTMSDAARRGIQLESYVCGLYKDYLNEEVEFTEFGSIKHPTRSIVRGSPDRMVKALDSGVTWGMDAKTRRYRKGWGDHQTSDVPLDTEIQMRVYMEIFDKPFWDVATLFGIDDFRVYRLDRDEKLGTQILDVAETWWETHVVGNMPPDPDGHEKTRELLAHFHDKPADELRQPTLLDQQLHEDLIDIRKRYKELGAEKDLLENTLRGRIGDDLGIKGIATWKQGKPRKLLDTKRLKAEDPELYEKYLSERPATRTLRVMGE